MSDNLIKNIQIGDLTYQIAGSQNNSSLTRGKSIPFSINEANGVALLARPNELSSLVIQESNHNGVVVALPHEMLQESGELWNIQGVIPIIVSHNSEDIPGCPHKATLCTLQPGFFEESSSVESVLNSLGPLGSLLNINTMGVKICIYCSDKFLDATAESTVIIRMCLMDGTVLSEMTGTGDEIQKLFNENGYPTTGKTMLIGLVTTGDMMGPMIMACEDILENPESSFSYMVPLNIFNTTLNLYAKTLEPGSIYYSSESEENPMGMILYVGPSYMDVNSINQYRFNINMPQDSMFITNIPVAWNYNESPTFSSGTITQILILDGIGTYNTVSLSEFGM